MSIPETASLSECNEAPDKKEQLKHHAAVGKSTDHKSTENSNVFLNYLSPKIHDRESEARYQFELHVKT